MINIGAQRERHVLLSYHAINHDLVVKISDYLAFNGFPIWKLVKGAKMEESELEKQLDYAVSNAVCIVCFVSGRYNDSKLCQLEIQKCVERELEVIICVCDRKFVAKDNLAEVIEGKFSIDFQVFGRDQSQSQNKNYTHFRFFPSCPPQ